MKRKINGSLVENISVYSGHDTTISALLNSIGVFDFLPPPFAATVLFELRQISGREPVVTVRTFLFNKKMMSRFRLVQYYLIAFSSLSFTRLEYIVFSKKIIGMQLIGSRNLTLFHRCRFFTKIRQKYDQNQCRYAYQDAPSLVHYRNLRFFGPRYLFMIGKRNVKSSDPIQKHSNCYPLNRKVKEKKKC